MAIKLLNESNTAPLVAEGAGFRAVMITPGKGSSGTYSEEVLARDASTAFPPGTLAFLDHPTEASPGRSLRNAIGTYPAGGTYEEGVGITSNLVPFPHWKDFVEAVAPHGGLSIYAMGESDGKGNVTALLPDVQNSVDLVAYPGRPGSGLTQMYEAAVAASETRTAIVVGEEKKDTNMTPEQEAKLDGLAASFASFVAETQTVAAAIVTESVVVEDAIAASDARVEATIVALEAVNDAHLPASLRAGLISSIKAGTTDIAGLIESAKALHTSIKAEVAESAPAAPIAGFVAETISGADHTAAFEELMKVSK